MLVCKTALPALECIGNRSIFIEGKVDLIYQAKKSPKHTGLL